MKGTASRPSLSRMSISIEARFSLCILPVERMSSTPSRWRLTFRPVRGLRLRSRAYRHILTRSVASANPARRGRVRRLWQSTVEGENEVWRDLRRNPGPRRAAFACWGGSRAPGARPLRAGVEAEGTGPFFPISSSIVACIPRYARLLAPRTEKKWLPSLSCQYMSIRPSDTSPAAPAPLSPC